jgi:hypothetical protein
MNNKIIVAVTIVAAGIVTYLISKKYKGQGNNNEEFVSARSHHLTKAFTRAKFVSNKSLE